MSLEVIKGGGQQPDAYEQLVEALRRVIVQIVDERQAEQQQRSWHWLTTKQASELLGISPHRVAARVREGKLPGRQYQGRTYVDGEELEKQIARHRVR